MARGIEHPTGWTDERTAQLRTLVADGVSASQIAGALGGGVTRNGVIGKATRMGLVFGGSPGRTATKPRTFTTASPATPAERAPPTPRPPIAKPALRIVKPAPAAGRPVTVANLRNRQCRWPIDDPGPGNGADMLFCACRTDEGATYCAAHARKAVARPISDAQRLAAANARAAIHPRRAGGMVWGKNRAGAFAE